MSVQVMNFWGLSLLLSGVYIKDYHLGLRDSEGGRRNHKSYSSHRDIPALFNSVSASVNPATEGGRENKPNMTPITKVPGFT